MAVPQLKQILPQTVDLPESWLIPLADEFYKPYMQNLKNFLQQRKASGATIYPKGSEYFAALKKTELANIKVVILGQDPYHNPHQAHGFAFSVPAGVAVPPSLKNIYKEIESSVGGKAPCHGCLEKWAEQGVLLLNAVLTVEENQPASHRNKGWETFTDVVIKTISNEQQGVVFMLWGAYARSKKVLIDSQKHLVLEAPHPSPLSAHRGFLGCGHFAKANEYLAKQGKNTVQWLNL